MKKVYLAISILLIAIVVLVVLAYWQLNVLLVTAGGTTWIGDINKEKKEIIVPLNCSTANIATMLEEEGIIKSALLFRLYARYRGYDQQLQAGQYLLTPGMSMEEILQELKQGVFFKETLRFTIPEGFTLEQIANRLDSVGLVNAEYFKEACQRYFNDDFDFLRDIPHEVKYRLEGYLFPDTYEVFIDTTAEDIITMMLMRFASVFNEEYQNRASELELTLHQVVTLASLVEKEGRIREEQPLISAVFHNRLKKQNMPLLQSCATVQYALGETKANLTNRDLEIDSPYNTYIYPDLPPGPIASPGLNAIEAALYPAPVDYLYFVSKEDGSGGHYFSKTLDEHNRYKTMVQRNRNNRS